jgi:hypothetical protein
MPRRLPNRTVSINAQRTLQTQRGNGSAYFYVLPLNAQSGREDIALEVVVYGMKCLLYHRGVTGNGAILQPSQIP